MKDKTKVRFTGDNQYGEGKEGEVGYIDGYCRGGDDRPYCVVIVGRHIYLATSHVLEVISEKEFLSKCYDQ